MSNKYIYICSYLVETEMRLSSGYVTTQKENFQASIMRVYILIDKLRSDLSKSQERLQTLFNSMVAQHQNFKLQMQPQAVSGFDLSVSNVTTQNIFVLSDMAPDIDPFQGITRVFSEPSNIDPHISRL